MIFRKPNRQAKTCLVCILVTYLLLISANRNRTFWRLTGIVSVITRSTSTLKMAWSVLTFLNYSDVKGSQLVDLSREQQAQFTMQGKMELKKWFFKLSPQHKSTTESVWTKSSITNLIRSAKSNLTKFCPYDMACSLLYRALDKYPLNGMKALVVGSVTPWVESIILSRGAREIVTQEYALLRSEHPQLSVRTPVQVAKNWTQFTDFDVGVSYSSIEHFGLGRYGDPLSANCDFLELKKLSCLIKQSGLLLLGVPIGKDQMVYNAHRIYGPIRLRLLTSNWKVEQIIVYRTDFSPSQIPIDYFADNDGIGRRQPILVLRNQRAIKCAAN